MLQSVNQKALGFRNNYKKRSKKNGKLSEEKYSEKLGKFKNKLFARPNTFTLKNGNCVKLDKTARAIKELTANHKWQCRMRVN